MGDILQYFESELDYIRRAFEDFELAFPQKAKELGITAGHSSDPDLQRLADTLALEAARLNCRMDDTIPEIALDLMRMISPEFLLGAPSYAVIKPEWGVSSPIDPLRVPKNTPAPIALNSRGDYCKFSVARETILAPVKIDKVKLDRAPFRYEVPDQFRGCEAALSLTLSSLDNGKALSETLGASLELYVSAKGGRKQRLVDVFSGEIVGLGYANVSTDSPVQLGIHVLPLGSHVQTMALDQTCFLPNELAFAQPFSRLRDFFAFPDRASFFTLKGIDNSFRAVAEGSVELIFFLTRRGSRMLDQVSDDDITTNAIPIVNIFTDESVPVRYDYTRLQVPIKPSLSSEMHVEALQVRDVRRLTAEGEQLLPSMTSSERRTTPDLPVWQERFVVGEFDGARREISFSVVKEVGEEPPPLDFVASVYCSNGRTANALKPGTRMFLEHDAFADLPFQLMDEPSKSISPNTRCEQLWDLISMINGNFWSIYGQQSPTEAVKETINLCVLEDNTDASNSVREVKVTPSTAPMQIGGNVLLVPGNIIEVTLDLDTLPFSGHVFAVALYTYFSSLVSYDRFFQLKVRECGREEPFKVFSRVHGSQSLS